MVESTRKLLLNFEINIFFNFRSTALIKNPTVLSLMCKLQKGWIWRRILCKINLNDKNGTNS